jgi:ferredoxin-NADP reductase/ferredoxin
VLSLTLVRADGSPVPAALPGQYVVLRLHPTAGGPPLFRTYSLSGGRVADRYRISVKVEPAGVAGVWLRDHVHPGDALDVSAPRGSFVLEDGRRPLVLLSAGIGATPLLAMLHSLADARSTRDVLWLHAARDRAHHPFADEVRALLGALPRARSFVCYSRPAAPDRLGRDFDAVGHLSPAVLAGLNLPPDAEVYLCGPARFMADMRVALAALGIAPAQIHEEIFNGGESIMPGVVGAVARPPHPPEGQAEGQAAAGPLVSFARSGVAAHWNSTTWGSLLELAEACDVPVRWSCRSGVCHTCESGLVSGEVAYDPAPLDQPARGNVLVCCARPQGDVVVDL